MKTQGAEKEKGERDRKSFSFDFIEKSKVKSGFCMGRKDSELKDFLIAHRKKIGTGTTNAPVWVMQKAGRRIYNKRAKKHWRETDMGGVFTKAQRKQGKVEGHRKIKSGDHYKRGMKVKKAKGRTEKRPI